jgi:hypothetical protein
MDFSRQQQNKQSAAAAWLQPQPCSNRKRQKRNREFRNKIYEASPRVATLIMMAD